MYYYRDNISNWWYNKKGKEIRYEIKDIGKK